MLDTIGQEQYEVKADPEKFWVGLYKDYPCIDGSNEVLYIGYERRKIPGYGKWFYFNMCVEGKCIINYFAIHRSPRGVGDFNLQGELFPTLYISRGITPRVKIFAPG